MIARQAKKPQRSLLIVIEQRKLFANAASTHKRHFFKVNPKDMPQFDYNAIRPTGERATGSIDAKNRSDALRKLTQQGLQPISLKSPFDTTSKAPTQEEAADSSSENIRLKNTEILYFTEDIADLLGAGLQLEPALAILEKRQENVRLKKVSTSLRNYVREGGSFSKALKASNKSFDNLYCSLVEAGEISGTLTEILRKQAQYISSIIDLQSRVKQALIYPSFLILAGASLMILFITVLIPKLLSLFTKTGAELPFITRMLVATSNLATNYWWLWISIIALSVLGFWYVISQPEGKKWWHRFQLNIPLFGPVIKLRLFTQMSHTLGTLTSNGIPLLKALQLMNRGNPNLHVQKQMVQVILLVEEGANLSTSLRKVPAFPPTTIDIIAVGEQTGDLGTALTKIAERNEKQLTQSIERLTSFIQPIIIVFIALLVGVVVYAIFTGIFESMSGLRK